MDVDDEQSAREPTPRRFRRYPFGWMGLRLIYPVVAIVVGAVFAITRSGSFLGDMGIGVVLLGIIAIPVAVWMAKRGI